MCGFVVLTYLGTNTAADLYIGLFAVSLVGFGKLHVN